MGPARAIQDHLHQGFVKGRDEMTEAMDPFSISQRLAQGLSHSDAHILIGVVIIDVGIPHR